MSEYTPDAEDAEVFFVLGATEFRVGYPEMTTSALHDGWRRWLAEHDREVAAKALIDAAQDIYLPSGGPSTYVDIDYAELLASLYLKARAEQIEKGTGE